MATPFLDRLGSSTLRLFVCFLMAVLLVVLGNINSLGGPLIGSTAVFLGGAVFALATASWQINARDRYRAAAMRRYWKPFSSDAIICLSTREPNPELEGNQLSSLTPYHDALAAHKIQTYLLQAYGREVPVVSATDLKSLESAPATHIVLIGGPNLNHLTDEFMDLAWTSYKGRYFHWSSTILKVTVARALVAHERDHLLKLYSSGESFRIDDTVHDVHDEDGQLVNARGMCLRLEGPIGMGRQVLVLAGVDNALGTLAAAEHVLDPDNVLALAKGDTQAVVGAQLNGRGLDSSISLRSIDRKSVR
jgi:hypothetical protein